MMSALILSVPVPVVRLLGYHNLDRDTRPAKWKSWQFVGRAESAWPAFRVAAWAENPARLWNPNEPVYVFSDLAKPAAGQVPGWAGHILKPGSLRGVPVLMAIPVRSGEVSHGVFFSSLLDQRLLWRLVTE